MLAPARTRLPRGFSDEFDMDRMLSEWGLEFFDEGHRRRTDLRRFDKFTQGQWWFFGRATEVGYDLPAKRTASTSGSPFPSAPCPPTRTLPEPLLSLVDCGPAQAVCAGPFFDFSAGGPGMKKLSDVLVIQIFVLLHVAVALLSRLFGLSDELVLTMLTMLLSVVLCWRKQVSVTMMAGILILVNVAGFLLSKVFGSFFGLSSRGTRCTWVGHSLRYHRDSRFRVLGVIWLLRKLGVTCLAGKNRHLVADVRLSADSDHQTRDDVHFEGRQTLRKSRAQRACRLSVQQRRGLLSGILLDQGGVGGRKGEGERPQRPSTTI